MYNLYQIRTRSQARNAVKQIDKLEQRAANSFGSLLSSHDQDELMALTSALDSYEARSTMLVGVDSNELVF